MTTAEEMTDKELLAVLGIPPDAPEDVAHAMVKAMVDGWTREGFEAVQAASREQATWSPERKEQARLESLRGQQREG